MSRQPAVVTWQNAASADIDAAFEYHLREGGVALALRFVDALEEAVQAIAAHPAAGSPRYAHELDLPGLRFRQLSGFPYLVFYVERGQSVEVWRVLHGARDIPGWLGGD